MLSLAKPVASEYTFVVYPLHAMTRSQASVFLLCLLVASCSPSPSIPSDVSEQISSESASQRMESGALTISATRNVSYIGTVDELGPSIMMQGTHKLLLSDGQFILLESTDANLSLNSYVGKRVEVRGSVQPTIEGNGGIMRVEEVTILGDTAVTASSDHSSSQPSAMCGGIAAISCAKGLVCIDDPNDSCDPLGGGADCSGICVPSVQLDSDKTSSHSSSSVPEVKTEKPFTPPEKESSSMQSSVQVTGGTTSQAADASIEIISKQKNYASLWTQKYCTSHRAFCISAHKNWYFKSFGATTTNLWHVEFSSAPIDELHTGPIVLNLVSGLSASMNAKDGEIRSEGTDVIGFKDWTGDTHFELIADARLRDAVSIMLRSIVPYSPAE